MAAAMMNSVLRILRLWQVQAWMDFQWVARDLTTALVYFGSDVVVNLAAVTATLLLAERFNGIGDWSTMQLVFMLGYAMLATALLNVLCGYNVLFVSRRIGRGQLDHTLIQPRPLWMAFLTEGFAPFSDSIALLPATGLIVWSLTQLPVRVNLLWLAAFALNVVASATIVLAFSYLWSSLAFWAPRAAEEISTSSQLLMNELKSFPLVGVGPFLLGGLLSIVPVGFVAWFPSRALLGLDHARLAILLTPLAAAVLLMVTAAVFRKGLQQYGHTGSQRYLSMGHRR